MEETITKNVTGGLNAIELVAGMALKPVVEKIAAPVVGNGSLISCGAKLAGAYMAHKYLKGTAGNIVSVALGADGAEDAIVALGDKVGIGAAKTTENGLF